MRDFVVLYRNNDLLPADAPLAFVCKGDDASHAVEQCIDAYPDCEVMWVTVTNKVERAYQDYWGYNVEGADAEVA